MTARRIAVVLFNLGGPDNLDAVEPFLFNLFSDPAILRLPAFVRGPLARFIARRRAPITRAIYEHIGGRSPILEETRAQAEALGAALAQGEDETRVFIAMRYWHPRADETAREILAYAPAEIVLLPLYPQFSTTTTASSLAEVEAALDAAGFAGRVRRICCWPTEPGFIAAATQGIRNGLQAAGKLGRARLLLSAHGLPERIVKAGDPYPGQVERTAAAIVAAFGEPGLDWTICYQSRVGPLKWIGPATEEEIRRGASEGLALVVASIGFVSEHSETLVELDIDYRAMALKAGAKAFIRVPTVSVHPSFVEGLAGLVRSALAAPEGPGYCNRRSCPRGVPGCPNGPASP